MYSICYVLVDDGEELEYYHELIISVCSLRKRHFEGEILVLLDQNTLDNINRHNYCECNQYRCKIVVVDVPQEFTQIMKSRFIKTSLRERITGDFLYLDTDTIIAEELPDEICQYEIALVLDVHSTLSGMSKRTRNFHLRTNKQCGFDLLDDREYFNSGVMWVKDTELSHRVFGEWHKKWQDYALHKGIVYDQPGINKVNADMGYLIHRLPDEYNVQVSGNPFPTRFIAKAKVIHYVHLSSSTYELVDKKVKMRGVMDPLVL